MLRPHAGEDPSHVLVLGTLGAQQRRFVRRRRARAVAPQPAPAAVPVTRATVIDAAALDSEAAAQRWLDGADHEAHVAAAIVTLNRVLQAHRIATADATPRDVGRAQALAVRVGYGAGEEVADGRHSAALELPPPSGDASGLVPGGRRSAALRPQERLAALLSGRDAALACEELALRARADLAAGRWREAALTLRVAVEAALSELDPWRDRGDLATRLIQLAAAREEVAAAAHRALEGGLDATEQEIVDRVLSWLEAALRARTASGIE
ncbi:hypothetical protein [Capillimicrobium parvum]|uniref:Uncharacterized protein n=1 Tax=Capillimicrobium parvum TaxID=2884022 RepID=A0A9E6Y0J3_9ACTN|nr:hypothetical protein [Capillimicrobium parvum]UGS37952.1 hypothetical protein DSM104329_04374 [Capillimicrobium parvum]